MRANRSLEIGTGLFVLLGFAALFFLTTQLPGSGLRLTPTDGYTVTARFDNIGGLQVGAPVTMAGVRVGEVQAITFDPNDYRAVVALQIAPEFDQIPVDSDAAILTQGLLGGNYVGLGPGGAETYLTEGSQIEFTQSAIVLENLVNRLFAQIAGGGGNDAANDTAAQPEEPLE